MPAPYTVPTSSDTGSLYDIFKFLTNAVSFMPVVLLVIWLVALIGSIAEGRQASRAFIFASFITSILAIILSLIGLLNTQYMYFSFLLVGGGIIWYMLSNAPGS